MNLVGNKQQRFNFKNRSGIKPWLYFLGAAVTFLILSPLFQKGCFIDGMLYKTVAYNYAEGQGSFWSMKFTNTSMREFCEQPPLYFYLLGIFYKIFGDHYLTDRFFTLLLFLLFIFVFNEIIKRLFKNSVPYLLLSLFFLVAVPVFCWSYVNQVIEPLLCVQVALAILFFIRFVESGKRVFILLFAGTLYLLFATKGFQSCFVIVLPLSYALVSKFRKNNYYFFAVSGLVFIAALVFCLKLYLPAAKWFACYYDARLVLTMNNVGNTTGNHLEIIGRFFSELIVCLGSVVILISYLKIKKKYPARFVFRNFMDNKIALSLLLTAFAGSFPYAVSLVQRGFYLIPSFICFVLAVVYGLKRYWLFFFFGLRKVSDLRTIQILMPAVFLAALVYSALHFTDYKRNKELLKDIELILPHLNKNETIVIDEARWNDFSLHAYLYMAKQISLSADKKAGKLLIRSKESPADSLRKIELNTKEIELYVLP